MQSAIISLAFEEVIKRIIPCTTSAYICVAAWDTMLPRLQVSGLGLPLVAQLSHRERLWSSERLDEVVYFDGLSLGTGVYRRDGRVEMPGPGQPQQGSPR